MEDADMRGLMALIGETLLAWSWVERRLKGRPIPADMADLRRIRNNLCHCLSSAHVAIEPGHKTHVVCVGKDGAFCYSAAVLEDALNDLLLVSKGRS